MATAAAAASGAVWLGYYPDGSLRANQPGKHRTRHKLPAFDWFRERLVRLGGDGFDKSVLSLLGGPASPWMGRGPGKASDVIPIAGLPRVSNSSCVHSCWAIGRMVR